MLSPSLAHLAELIKLLPVERDTAFVIMPFEPPYASYFEAFYRPSLEESGYRAFRAWGGLANVRYSPSADDWPCGSVLQTAALISLLSSAAEGGRRLRVPPESLESALEWAGRELQEVLVPPEAHGVRLGAVEPGVDPDLDLISH